MACAVPRIGRAPLSGRGIEAVRRLAAGRFGFFSGLLSLWVHARSAGHHGEARQSRGLHESNSNGSVKGSNPVFRTNDPGLSESTKAYLGGSEGAAGKEKEGLQGFG